MFDIKMVTTDKGNRRSGLGTDLLRRSVQLASSLGYKVIQGIQNCKILELFDDHLGHKDRGYRKVFP